MTQNYYCSARPDNRLSVTAVMVPAVPSTITRGALSETIGIPKLLHHHHHHAYMCPLRHKAQAWILAQRQQRRNKCDDVPALDLIAAWMWNCGMGGGRGGMIPWKTNRLWQLMWHPQRVEDFHRGLSNVVYLFCVNCSDVWSDFNWAITLLWGWAGYDIVGCRITWRILVSFVRCSSRLPFRVVIRSILSACFSQMTPSGRATHFTFPAGHVGNWRRRLGAGWGGGWVGVILTSLVHV